MMALKLGTILITGVIVWLVLFIIGSLFVKPGGGWRVPYFWFKIIMFMSTMFSFTYVRVRAFPKVSLKDLIAMACICSVLDLLVLHGALGMEMSMLFSIVPAYFIGAVFAYTQKKS